MYTIFFQGTDRPGDEMWFTNPKVGDIVKTGLLSDGELEYWIILEIDGDTIALGPIV